MVNHELFQFGALRSSESGCMTCTICYVTPQGHGIQGSCDLLGGSSALYVTTLSSLVTISIALLEI